MENFKSVKETIWTNATGTISNAKKNILNGIYNNAKPSIVEDPNTGITPVYELIQVDIALEGDTLVKGLLNCRVDGEHFQVRF